MNGIQAVRMSQERCMIWLLDICIILSNDMICMGVLVRVQISAWPSSWSGGVHKMSRYNNMGEGVRIRGLQWSYVDWVCIVFWYLCGGFIRIRYFIKWLCPPPGDVWSLVISSLYYLYFIIKIVIILNTTKKMMLISLIIDKLNYG